MDARIDFDDRRFDELLARLSLQSGGRLRPAFAEIGQLLKASTQQRFRDQHGPNRSPWRRVRRGGQALRLSGRLRNSIQYRADDRSVEVGTNVVYAKAHQFGLDEQQAVKPHTRLVTKVFGRALRFPVYGFVRGHTRHMRIWARPFLGFSDTDIEDIEAVVLDRLDRLFQGRS